MQPILLFSIILIVISISGVFGGLKLKDYLENRENEKATKDLIIAILWAFGGFLISTGLYLTFDGQDSTRPSQEERKADE